MSLNKYRNYRKFTTLADKLFRAPQCWPNWFYNKLPKRMTTIYYGAFSEMAYGQRGKYFDEFRKLLKENFTLFELMLMAPENDNI